MSTHVHAAVLTYNCGREAVNPRVLSTHLSDALIATSESPSSSLSSSTSSSSSRQPSTFPALLVLALQEFAPIPYAFLGGSFAAQYFASLRKAVEVTSERLQALRGDDGGRGDGDGDGESDSDSDHTGYIGLAHHHVGMTAIMVFARRDFCHRVDGLDTGGTGVGWYEMGNKGAVAVNVRVKGDVAGRETGHDHVDITFVAAHLAPMEWALERRNLDWQSIVQGTVLNSVDGRKPVARSPQGAAETEPLLGEGPSEESGRGLYTQGRHLVVAGDLNYRTCASAPRPSSRAMFPRLSVADDSPLHYSNLLPSDQLTREIRAGRTLQGFDEAPITFAPTYKYAKAASEAMLQYEADPKKLPSPRPGDEDMPEALAWPWSAHRWPSWCDRVLFLPSTNFGGEAAAEESDVRPVKYTSLPLMSTSDHQPVLLQLEIPWSRPHGGVRAKPPYDIDPHWRQRRAAARRLEIATGLGAYLSTTREGRVLVLAVVAGAIGGWLAVQQLL